MEKQFSFEAIGTTWHISFQTPQSQTLLSVIVKHIDQFDKSYSRFRNDSLIMKMAKRKGTYLLPSDAKKLLNFYKTLYDITNGAVTPLIGQLLADAGYDHTYSLQPKRLSAVPAWEEVLEYQFPYLTIKRPVLLDFGAAGKGYLIDQIGNLLQDEGIVDYCINAGGDILYHNIDNTILRVGLENPRNAKQVIGVAAITAGSICGSSGNRRKWGRFHHIMDPKTRTSVETIQACWVTAESALLADGLTTALFFIPPSVLQKTFTFEYALVNYDSRLEKSENFPATFF